MNNKQIRNRLMRVDNICKTENGISEKFGLSEAKFWEICDSVRRVASPLVSKGTTIRLGGHYFIKTKNGNLACIVKRKWACWQSHNRRTPAFSYRFIYRIRHIRMYWIYLRVDEKWLYFNRSNYLAEALDAAFSEDVTKPF